MKAVFKALAGGLFECEENKLKESVENTWLRDVLEQRGCRTGTSTSGSAVTNGMSLARSIDSIRKTGLQSPDTRPEQPETDCP